MFFDMDLLCRQRNGKFALVWLAATRQLSDIKKENLIGVNIVKMCEDILQYVMSNTTIPRERLSLYLSAKLMYGTVVIHQYQVKTLERQIKILSLSVRRPYYKFEEDADEIAKKEKRKRTKKDGKEKKPPKKPEMNVVEELLMIEEQMLRTLPEGAINATDVVNITLRDEISTRININDPELFGDEGQLDQQLALLGDLAFPQIPDPGVQSATIPAPSNAEKTPTKRRTSAVEEVGQSPNKRLRPQKGHTTPVVNVQAHGTLSPASPHGAIMPPPPSSAILMPPPPVPSPRRPPLTDATTTLTNAEIIANLAAPVTPPPARPRGARKRLSMDFDVFTPSKWHHVTVHREQELEIGRRTPVKQGSQSLSQSPNLSQKGVDIIAEMLSGIRFNEEDLLSVFNDVRGRFSIPRLRTREQQPEVDVAPVVQAEPTAPEEVSTRQTRAQTPVQQPQDVSIMPSPRLSRIPLEFEPVDKSIEKSRKEKQLPQIRQTDDYVPRIHTSTPIRGTLDTEAKRHKELLKQIRGLFSNTQCESITLEQLCEPCNRLTVARIFQGLLHLQSQRYLRMTSCENSLELNKIFLDQNFARRE